MLLAPSHLVEYVASQQLAFTMEPIRVRRARVFSGVVCYAMENINALGQGSVPSAVTDAKVAQVVDIKNVWMLECLKKLSKRVDTHI